MASARVIFVAAALAWTGGCGVAIGACGAAGEPPADAPSSPTFPGGATFLLTNARALEGTTVSLAVLDGEIVEADALPPEAPRVDAEGATIVPAFVDAHVHFSFAALSEQHAALGIAVAIDLGAPLESLDGPHVDPLLVLRAGPMITSVGGYPLDSWGHAGADGHGGYGIECDDEASCARRVDELVDRGADVVKLALLEGTLEGPLLDAVVTEAHARGRVVLAHALTDRDARRAASAGVDVLAHTPIEPLSAETIAALEGRAVISTMSAFGGSRAIANVRALREGGVTIVYGTDLGNTRTAGIDPRELGLLVEAGLDARAIVEAATTAPARIFGLTRHGSLEPGHAASFLLHRGPVREDPVLLAHPDLVVLDGRAR